MMDDGVRGIVMVFDFCGGGRWRLSSKFKIESHFHGDKNDLFARGRFNT
jgi:hypothetical protein